MNYDVVAERPLYLRLKWLLAKSIIGMSSRRRFIFCATTGRSGTHTLSEIFDTLPDVVAEHEPWPTLNAKLLQKSNSDDPENQEFVKRMIRYFKIPRIVSTAGLSNIYVEANHQFIKSFAFDIADIMAEEMKVIILRRPIAEVAASLWSRGDVPGTKRGNLWTLDPEWPRNLVKASDLLGVDSYSHPFFRLVWYCIEVEARIRDFQQRYPAIPTFEMATAELNERGRVLELAEWLGITGIAMTKLNRSFEPVRADASSRPPSLPDGIIKSDLDSFIETLHARME